MSLSEHLQSARLFDANHVALVAGARRWTYGQLDEVTRQLAAGLVKLGLQPGERVALQLSNCPELVIAYYACFKLGAICVPINNRFAAPEIEYAINHAACRICISQSNLYTSIAPIRSRLKSLEHVFLVDCAADLSENSFAQLLNCSADSVSFPAVPDDAAAAILYTSGTTSRPKGVTHTHKSLAATAHYHGTHTRIQSDDIVCIVPPMCHIFGFATQMVTGIWAKAQLVIIPRFDPELILRTIEEHHGTRIAGLPVMFQALVSHPQARQYSIRSLRFCFGGGDAVPIALQEKFRSTFGVPILEGCGMTEVIPFTLNLPGNLRMGSIGQACPGMTIRLVDDAGKDVALGSVGEILVRSDAAMIGYWQDPEATESTMAGGFIHTGDLGRLDEDGYYWFLGRKKQIIIRAGSNISPLEVEDALYQHPAVGECGVVGVPDPAVGEAVWAFVALSNDQAISAEELQGIVRERIAAYKVPEVITFVSELPKGPTGKVCRRTLREIAVRERQGTLASHRSVSHQSATTDDQPDGAK
jgi:long-chain acyl-CoA synthetase